MRSPAPRVGFVLEKALGHATHADNLQRLIGPDDRIRPTFAPIEFEADPRWSRVPGYDNWTVRAGIRARRAVRTMQRGGGHLDALFVHTQVPAMLMPDRLRHLPSVVSLDATPIQYDELGAHYGHVSGSDRAERFKWRLHRTCFARATALVTWAEWTKAGLVERYEVPADKVVVIPPGVDAARWAASDRARRGEDHVSDRPVRVLFVGADLARKGGNVLVDAVRRLRARGVAVELDLVTQDDVTLEAGVVVHHGLRPNSSALIELYRRADIFCLPTLGDCLPMVLSEAGAVGLPLVSTNVGAIGEICRDGETGLIVPPNDDVALAAALERLVEDSALRWRFGDAAQQLVRTQFDAGTNAGRLVELLVTVARGEPGR